jgi:hypothetical protein
MNANINTNLDDYSNQELEELLELPNNYTKDDVINIVNFLNNNYFQDNENLNNFFENIQSKLLDNYNENHNENILPDYANIIETMDNMNNDTNDNTNDDNTTNDDILRPENDSYNIYDLIKQNEDHIENYNTYNYLHFNTLFRAKNNSLLETAIPATNSNFILSSPINNISRIKLASINIKKPYLISSSKLNNTFIIKKFATINGVTFCDFSNSIVIEDGYYDDPKTLENYLNYNYFDNSSTDISFLKNIHFSINENSNEILFELSNNYLTNSSTTDASFVYFSLDFKTNYTKYYSLASIFGFDFNKASYFYTSINDTCNNRLYNSKINSTYTFSNKGNTELFFCLDEFQSNIVETHKLFLNNNMSTQKILAKINGSLGTAQTNYYINETYSITDTRNDHTRQYDGVINLLNFNIKIIDYYGNIVNTNINEDFTFTLEVKINNTRLLKDN